MRSRTIIPEIITSGAGKGTPSRQNPLTAILKAVMGGILAVTTIAFVVFMGVVFFLFFLAISFVSLIAGLFGRRPARQAPQSAGAFFHQFTIRSAAPPGEGEVIIDIEKTMQETPPLWTRSEDGPDKIGQ